MPPKPAVQFALSLILIVYPLTDYRLICKYLQRTKKRARTPDNRHASATTQHPITSLYHSEKLGKVGVNPL